MQTRFSETQLQDRGIIEANDILRKCVHCGFCTATCPTYVTLGDELDSPRGRIYLIKEVLESGKPATEATARNRSHGPASGPLSDLSFLHHHMSVRR